MNPFMKPFVKHPLRGTEMKQIIIPEEVKNYMSLLEESGFEAYVVGGAVRDSILGEMPKDWDIFTNAVGEQIQVIFPEGKVIGGEERQEKILTVVVNGIEISSYRKSGDRKEIGGTIISHLRTCDFTINAIAANKEGEIYDPMRGQSDLGKDIIIRAVGDPAERMNEDKLRALRGIRFCAKYESHGVSFDNITLEAIKSTDIKSIAPQRIQDELRKILRYEYGLTLLKDTCMLEQFWPEFIPMIGMDGGSHHREDVWTHTDLSYRHSVNLTDNVMHHIATALHDIGKPTDYRIEDGKINFKGHNLSGARIAMDMMERLKFPKRDIEYVTTLIRHHLFGISGEPRLDKGYRRLYEDLERISKKENSSYPNIVEDLTLLFYCDYQGNLANQREKFGDYLTNEGHMGPKITHNYYKFRSEHKPFTVADLKVRGSDIINMGVEGGKRVGMLLDQVFKLTVEGILQNERHEQMFWMREQIRLEKEINERRENHGK